MPRDSLHIACYDVSDDAERERVARVLEGFGFRVQFSVFECRLTVSHRERLLAAIEALALDTGHVALYRVDARSRRRTVGAPPPRAFIEEAHSWIV